MWNYFKVCFRKFCSFAGISENQNFVCRKITAYIMSDYTILATCVYSADTGDISIPYVVHYYKYLPWCRARYYT